MNPDTVHVLVNGKVFSVPTSTANEIERTCNLTGKEVVGVLVNYSVTTPVSEEEIRAVTPPRRSGRQETV